MKIQNYLFLFIASIFLWGCGEDNEILPEIGDDAVTDITQISQAPDRLKYVGRDIELSGVMVQDVVGDYVFWAGERYQALPFVLEREARGVTEESEIEIRSGQRVNVKGDIRLTDALAEDSPVWSLVDDQEREEIKSAVIYISAFEVSIE